MRRRTTGADSTTRWLAARDRTTGALLVLGLALPAALSLAVLAEVLPAPPLDPGTALPGALALALGASGLCRLHERLLARRLPPVPPPAPPALGPASRAALRLRPTVRGLAVIGGALALVALAVHLVLWARGHGPEADELFHRVALVGVALAMALIPVSRAICRAEIDHRRTTRLGGESTDQPA